MGTNLAAEILRERYGVTGPATVHETWGASVVVEVQGLILKANGDRSTVAEALVIERVRAAGVPAPQIIGSGSDRRLPGGSWIVMRRMPGRSFDASNATSAQVEQAVHDVAGHLTTLHAVVLPGWGWVGEDGRGTSSSWKDWLTQQIATTAAELRDRLPKDFALSAARAIDVVVPDLAHGCVLNGDLGLAHIFVDPPTGMVTGILDWAAAIIGDPLFDVATFSMGGPAGDPIQATLQPRLLAAYGAEPDDPRIGLYRAINHLFNARWSVENGVLSWTDDLCRAAAELISQF